MASLTRASVVVASYNGAQRIGRLLESLSKQSFGNVELVVVIDGSTDNTADIVESFLENFRHLKIISQKNSGRSVARNNGAREATGDLLVFYDDDMIPDFDSVARHCAFHRGHSGIVCGDMVEIAGKDKTDMQNYKAWLNGRWMDKYVHGLNRLDNSRIFFTAANCSFTTESFWNLGGFDEGLTDAEDYDLAVRAMARGIPVYFDRNNKAVHNDEITCRKYIRRLREYAAAHQLRSSDTPVQQQTSNGALKSIIYKVVSFPVLVRWIDSGFFTFFLPRNMRFRLYSIIIHSLAHEHSDIRL